MEAFYYNRTCCSCSCGLALDFPKINKGPFLVRETTIKRFRDHIKNDHAHHHILCTMFKYYLLIISLTVFKCVLKSLDSVQIRSLTFVLPFLCILHDFNHVFCYIMCL